MSDDRIRAIAELLYDEARRRSMSVSADGRIGEIDAAALLCLSAAYLRQLRADGSGPTWHRTPLAGSSYSYTFEDLAAWILLGRRSASERVKPR